MLKERKQLTTHDYNGELEDHLEIPKTPQRRLEKLLGEECVFVRRDIGNFRLLTLSELCRKFRHVSTQQTFSQHRRKLIDLQNSTKLKTQSFTSTFVVFYSDIRNFPYNFIMSSLNSFSALIIE